MIVDAHAHIFPEKIRVAAVKGIGDFYGYPIKYDGSPETLLKLGQKYGIDKFLVLSVATAPKQVSHINDFLAEVVMKNKENFIGFMALHPDFTDVYMEIERCVSMGLKGIKLHPDFQRFKIDDRRAYPIYEAAEDRLPILVHMGDTRLPYSKPKALAKVMEDFPNLQFIGAHFGGWSEWDDAEKYLAGKENIWVDTSSSKFWLNNDRIKELINAYGTEHVLFGSDFPMWNPGDELENLRTLGLSDGDLEKILGGNIQKLLNL